MSSGLRYNVFVQEDTPSRQPVRFGTFTGVFTPTLLTILGVIMYVRMGWVVGNAGLGGALLVMGLAIGITACTGLSLSSIATNTRIGPGGPYAIFHKSLGLEVGGSIGIPLFLTRPLGVAMYVIGFREGWQWVFPEHPAIAVDLLVLALLFGIAWKSADLAFKTQYLIMGIIGISLLSIFGSPVTWAPTHEIQWWGDYPGFVEEGFSGADFWVVFAVFFPATTGILAGANMSGDLKDPRRAIPDGTLWAIGLSSIIYVAVAVWVARSGSPEELASNYTHIIDTASFGPGVLAGLLGATFSSALAGLVGGPRILQAMGRDRLVPQARWLASTSADGEPRNALLVTGVLTFACVMVRDLNAIAPLVTMFFLITYCVLNVVVLVEGSLGLVSFRPTLALPLVVPLLGLIGCVFAMFIVNPTFGLLAVMVVLGIYATLRRRGLEDNGEGVRSSIFVALAEKAAAQVTAQDLSNVRAWKPNFLVPVEDPEQLRGEYDLLLHIARPEGSIKLLGLAAEGEVDDLEPRVARLGQAFKDEGLFCTWSVFAVPGFVTAISVGLMALQSAFFRPNILLLTLPEVSDRMDELNQLVRTARDRGVGALLVAPHRRAGLGQRQRIVMWVRAHPESWDPDAAFASGNMNLILLMGVRLVRTWKAELELRTVVPEPSQEADARRFLRGLCDLARLPVQTERRVLVGDFVEQLGARPAADLSIFGLEPEPHHGRLSALVEQTRSTCLFVRDSGRESARA